MNHQLELAYLVLEIPDPEALTPILADVIGLTAGDPTPSGALTWRNDDRVHRLIVEAGDANDAVTVGVEAVDIAAFDATVSRLRTAGFEVVDADGADRSVERLTRTAAPWGTTVEIVLGLARAATPFSSAKVPGGFLTEGVGFGHLVFPTTAFDESHAFLIEGLGFRQSDWLELALEGGVELEVRFYHCNARHHTLALAKAPFDLPQLLNHIMFEVRERDDVGAVFDRAWAAGLPIPSGLGCHDNDRMFSFYLQTPAGFQIEIGHGARVVTDDWNDNRRYDRISSWGHQPLRQG